MSPITFARAWLPVAMALGAIALGACGGGGTSKDTGALQTIDAPASIEVTSPAFVDGAAIPRANTCDGTGGPPTIRWTAVPAAAKTVAVVVDDPDAPRGTFLHWLVIGLPAAPGSVPSAVPGVSELDNTGGTRGWTPPCPPAGATHHYRFTVYALRDYVCADNGDASNGPGCSAPSSVQALAQIRNTAIARGVLVGMYRR
jgi:Raf kinase inhibitor-like YbhB/YbcL family protein